MGYASICLFSPRSLTGEQGKSKKSWKDTELHEILLQKSGFEDKSIEHLLRVTTPLFLPTSCKELSSGPTRSRSEVGLICSHQDVHL